jgi:hypothetical protein
MQSDSDDKAPEAATAAAASAALARAEAYRERFRRSQLIARQVARARAAGGPPSDNEAGRLVAEFHARGGRVTVLPEPEEVQPDAQDVGKSHRRRPTR